MTPEADFVYTDEDEIDARGRHSAPSSSPTGRRSGCGSSCTRAGSPSSAGSLLEEVGGFSAELGDAAAEWDIALRVTERARAVLHVPGPLYHRRARGDDGERTAGGRESGCGRCRPTATGSGCRPGSRPTRFAREGAGCSPALKKAPPVSIVIPTCGQSRAIRGEDTVLVAPLRAKHPRDLDLRGLRDRLRRRHVDRPRDSGRAAGAGWRAVAHRRLRPAVQLLRQGQPGRGAQLDGEQLLFLNDDMEVITPDWIERMVMYAGHAGIGAVGAQLRWEDERVQHAGHRPGDGPAGARLPRAAGGRAERLRTQRARDPELPRGHGRLPDDRLATSSSGSAGSRSSCRSTTTTSTTAWRCGSRACASSTTPTRSSTTSSPRAGTPRSTTGRSRCCWSAGTRRPGRTPIPIPSLRYGEPRAGLLRRGARFAKARLSPRR